jgi:hypothetical protein
MKCKHCKTEMREVKGDNGIEIYCPNEMCLNDEFKEVRQ